MSQTTTRRKLTSSNKTKRKLPANTNLFFNPDINLELKDNSSNITLILFPNQLFHADVIKKSLAEHPVTKINIIMLEHPVYFGNRGTPYGQMRFNRLKLLYQLATTRYYLEKTLAPGLSNQHIHLGLVKIITNKSSSITKTQITQQIKLAKCDAVFYYDPADSILQRELDQIAKYLAPHPVTQLPNPGFLCSLEDLASYHKSKPSPDSYTHASFYNWQRDRLNNELGLSGHKTYDTENRDKLPANITIPDLPPGQESLQTHTKPYITRAIKIIKASRLWSSFPGPLEPEALQFPLSHEASAKWLDHFCVHRLAQFGKYQDAIDGKGRNFLFHSCISPMLNIGLLTPDQVLRTVSSYYKAHKSANNISIQAYEGFIRQVIGWREYQRYIYMYIGEQMRSSNHFGNKIQDLGHAWYEGTLGIKPVDDAIQMAFRDGYLHHILRLMVMGNFMNLVGIHPHTAYKWFMEFSLDSYDWVMVGNVYSMAFWADGGLTMRKPYISSSAYIFKMSTYPPKDSQEWAKVWDSAFHYFIDRNASKLERTYYAGLVRAWKKKSSSIQREELKPAITFLKD